MLPLVTKALVALAAGLCLAVIISAPAVNGIIGAAMVAGVLIVVARMSQAQEHFQRWEDYQQLRRRMASGGSAEPHVRIPRLPWER